ncbi:MAG: M67 family metallopeptidase [Chloroflexaceae bacterium]|nr:M67 family metallopeptidase [Chloroflexaceae bacterium]
MIHLTAEAAHQVGRHAEATYPDECVGLLLGNVNGMVKQVRVAYPVENRWAGQVTLSEEDHADSRQDRFYLDPRDYLRADREARAQGLDIVGCYHSHPDHPAEPSERDLVGAQGVGGGTHFSFVIQSVRRGAKAELTSWLLLDDGTRFGQEELTIEP